MNSIIGNFATARSELPLAICAVVICATAIWYVNMMRRARLSQLDDAEQALDAHRVSMLLLTDKRDVPEVVLDGLLQFSRSLTNECNALRVLTAMLQQPGGTQELAGYERAAELSRALTYSTDTETRNLFAFSVWAGVKFAGLRWRSATPIVAVLEDKRRSAGKPVPDITDIAAAV